MLHFCDFAHRKRDRNEDYYNDDFYSDYSYDDADDNNVYHDDDVVSEIMKIKWLSLQDDDMKFKWYDYDDDDDECHYNW